MYQLPYYDLVYNFCMSSEVLLLLNPTSGQDGLKEECADLILQGM